MATAYAAKTISPKQSAFIASLLETRKVPEIFRRQYSETMTSSEASDLIDDLKQCPWKNEKPQVKTVTTLVGPGIYCQGGAYYKVQQGKESKKCYALTWNGHKWVFAKGAIFKLTASDKATAEQAKAFAVQYGSCCNCHKTLTKQHSIDLGYGPVCAETNGWPY